MKSNLFALLGAAVGFGSGFIITYKLRNCRRPYYCTFWEIYEDNAEALQRGDDLFE